MSDTLKKLTAELKKQLLPQIRNIVREEFDIMKSSLLKEVSRIDSKGSESVSSEGNPVYQGLRIKEQQNASRTSTKQPKSNRGIKTNNPIIDRMLNEMDIPDGFGSGASLAEAVSTEFSPNTEGSLPNVNIVDGINKESIEKNPHLESLHHAFNRDYRELIRKMEKK
jgi:hypothetical protein